jgi:hypothetical protein
MFAVYLKKKAEMCANTNRQSLIKMVGKFKLNDFRLELID